jgi:hypothetical protein
MEGTQKELEKHGFLDLLFSSKLTAINTDGNDNLIGKENELIQKLRQNLGHVIGMHCVAHKQ